MQSPAIEIVRVLGHDVPVLEDGTLGEFLDLEELESSVTGLKRSIEMAKIFLRHRCDVTLSDGDVRKLSSRELENLEQNLTKLINPFRERQSLTILKKIMSIKSPAAIEQKLMEAKIIVKQLEKSLAEATTRAN
jgi:uncharacterized protein (UPF0216 family)